MLIPSLMIHRTESFHNSLTFRSSMRAFARSSQDQCAHWGVKAAALNISATICRRPCRKPFSCKSSTVLDLADMKQTIPAPQALRLERS